MRIHQSSVNQDFGTFDPTIFPRNIHCKKVMPATPTIPASRLRSMIPFAMVQVQVVLAQKRGYNFRQVATVYRRRSPCSPTLVPLPEGPIRRNSHSYLITGNARRPFQKSPPPRPMGATRAFAFSWSELRTPQIDHLRVPRS